MATSATHSLLDTLVENLKIELVTKMHADIDRALRKRDNALQAMVQEMLAQHKAQMLDVLMDKVKEEVLIYTDSTNDAMACFMGDMQCQFNDQIKRLVQREVALQLEAKLVDNKKEKDDDNNKQGQIFFRRDMFKKYMEEDQSEVKEFDTDFMEEESMNLLANIDGV